MMKKKMMMTHAGEKLMLLFVGVSRDKVLTHIEELRTMLTVP